MGSPEVTAHYTRHVHLEVTLTATEAYALRLMCERVVPQLKAMPGDDGLQREAAAACTLLIAALDGKGIRSH